MRIVTADAARRCLLIPVDIPNDEIAVYSVALTSLGHDRILAAASDIAD
jgi:hypothetical protein